MASAAAMAIHNKDLNLQRAVQHLNASNGVQEALECVNKLLAERRQVAQNEAAAYTEPVARTFHVAKFTHPLKDLEHRLISYLEAAPEDLPLLAIGIRNVARALERNFPHPPQMLGYRTKQPAQTLRELHDAVDKDDVGTAHSLIVREEIDVTDTFSFLHSMPFSRSLEMCRLLIQAGNVYDIASVQEFTLVLESVQEIIPKALGNRAWRPVLQAMCSPTLIVAENNELFHLALQSTEHMDLLCDCGFHPVRSLYIYEGKKRLLPALLFNGIEKRWIRMDVESDEDRNRLQHADEIITSFFTNRANVQVTGIHASISCLQTLSPLIELVGAYARDNFENVSFVAHQGDPLATHLLHEMRTFCYAAFAVRGFTFLQDRLSAS